MFANDLESSENRYEAKRMNKTENSPIERETEIREFRMMKIFDDLTWIFMINENCEMKFNPKDEKVFPSQQDLLSSGNFNKTWRAKVKTKTEGDDEKFCKQLPDENLFEM